MQQTPIKHNLFRYGVRQSSPQVIAAKEGPQTKVQSSIILETSDPNSLGKENGQLKLKLEEKQEYINKLLGIINKQRKEISDKHHLISCLEVDLRKYKKLSQELQETVKYLSELKVPMKQRKGSNINQAQSAVISEFDGNQVPFFEKFLIITVDKSQVYEAVRESTEPFLMQTIMLNMTKGQTKDQNWQNDYKAILPQIVFPYGVETKLCKRSDSLSELNEIIYNGLSPDKFENVSVLTFKSDEAFQTENSHWLSNVNPNNLLYCICMEQRDFFNEEQPSPNKKRKFISALKSYVFMTKLPLITYFVDILHVIINDLKLRKARLHAAMELQVNIDAIDINFHQQYESEFEKVLQNLIEVQIKEKIEAKIFNEALHFSVPELDQCEYMEFDWGAYLILSILSLSQFVRILSALLCEQQVVIVSEKRNIISASMLLFHSLLKPFKWVHPLISTISTEMMQLFDSPVPIFIGVLRDDRFVVVEEIYDTYDSILFVEFEGSLKEGPLRMTLIQQKEIEYTSSPFLHKLTTTLSPLFSRLKMKDNITNQIEYKDIIPTPDEFEIRTYREIFEQVKLFYECEIIDHIPEKSEICTASKIDYQSVIQQVQASHKEDEFIAQFLSTQCFTFFLEEKFK